MKTTGIIRRIDELGRIVIPKEIRKNLRIKDGDNIEIYLNGDNVVLKKHVIMGELSDIISNLVNVLYSNLRKNIFIMNSDVIIASSGKIGKELLGQNISEDIEKLINERKNVLERKLNCIKVVNTNIDCYYTCAPIIANGDAMGLVLVLSEKEKLNENDYQIVKIVASFLSNYLEQ